MYKFEKMCIYISLVDIPLPGKFGVENVKHSMIGSNESNNQEGVHLFAQDDPHIFAVKDFKNLLHIHRGIGLYN